MKSVIDKQSKQIISAQYDDLIRKYELDMHSLFVESARYDEDNQKIKNPICAGSVG